MSLSKPEDDNVFQQLLRKYLKLLKERPILTKACTSGLTSALGSILSQYIAASGGAWTLNRRSVLAFAMTGFFFVGPTMHHLYRLLEELVPATASNATVKRLFIERLIFAPTFLLAYFYVLNMFEGHSIELGTQKVKLLYLIALKMNWKILTFVQFINIRYIPPQYRVLFGNFISLAWNCYIALLSKRPVS